MQGNEEEADKLAAQASALVVAGSPQHLIAASELQQRGLFDWSEREYKRFLSAPSEHVGFMVTARILFAEMLHDLERPLDAAEVLQKLSDAMARDRQVLQEVQHNVSERKPGSIRSRMHYFYALHYEGQKNVAAQRKHLEEGIAQDKTDADVLIAMYRLSKSDPELRKRTMKLIGAAEEQFRREVEQAPDKESGYNQYAWLIGNTEGDFDLAIKYSHRSLELKPETAGFLDTLAHCYAAKGDYENAVRYQSQAVELDPHTRQIKQALDRFKAELEKKREA
jgi:tetratricopeptide (TPR) repeat protein